MGVGICNNDPCFVTLEYTENKEESKDVNNTYGFSLKLNDFYIGYARNKRITKDSIKIQEGFQTIRDEDGNILFGIENKPFSYRSKHEDIEKIYNYYGIAYFYHNEDNSALHIEANLSVHPEARVEARDDNYQTSSSKPYTDEYIVLEARSSNGFFISYGQSKRKIQKASWEDENVLTDIENQYQIFLGYHLENVEFSIHYGKQENKYGSEIIGKMEQTQTTRALLIGLVF